MNPAHDRINLTRLVARIQRDIDDRNSNDWVVAPETLKQTTLHATAVSRKIAYARELLTNVESDELNEPQSSSRQRANADIGITLDKLEHSVQDVQHRLALLRASTKPPPSLLSTLPIPTEPVPAAPAPTPSVQTVPDTATLIPGATSPLSPELTTPTPHDEPLALFPPKFKPTPKRDASAALLPGEPPAFLATSLQTQEALSSQLADMAVQLRRNAEHFGTALEKDKGVVELVQEKLEQNLGSMVANRGSLKIVAAKSGGTTWLVFISVMVVAIAWVMMMFLIRLTR